MGHINVGAEAEKPATTSSVEFEEIQAHAGSIGRWQWMIFFIGSLSGFFNAFHHVGYVFLGAVPDHWCDVPNPNNWTLQQLKAYAIPKEQRSDKEEFSQCQMYDRNYSIILDFPPELANLTGNITETFTNSTVEVTGHNLTQIPCRKWAFNHSEYSSTIVSQWDLVCERTPLLSTVQGTYMAGVFIGCFLYGMLSDRYGRRPAILAAMVLFMTSGIAAAFSVHYVMFIILRMILAMSAAGLFTCTFVLATEITDPKHRCMFGIFFQIPFAMGYMLLPGIAFFIRDWQNLQLTIAIPNILLIAYIWLLPESPRWLITKGRFSEALTVLKEAAKTNLKTLPPDDEMLLLMKVYQENESSQKMPQEQRTSCALFLDLFRRPHICRRLAVVYFTWFVVAMVYYGLVISVGNLPGNTYFISFVFALVELPAYGLVYLITMKGGRRVGYCSTFLAGGAACLLILAIPQDIHWAITTLAILGKFCVTATFAISYLFTAELFPTSVRNVAVNSSSMCGRIGSISAPYIVTILTAYHRVIPLVLFGTLSVVAGVLALFLPETNRKNLMETWKNEKDLMVTQNLGITSGNSSSYETSLNSMTYLEEKVGKSCETTLDQ